MISGRVLHGRKLGREIGFPTLNLRIAHRHPAIQGVFAVRVHGLEPRARPGVASLGLRPTVDDSGRWMLEVHLFDFAEQVYGRLVCVEFLQKLRDEERYSTIDQLAAAIADDARRARAVLAGDRSAVGEGAASAALHATLALRFDHQHFAATPLEEPEGPRSATWLTPTPRRNPRPIPRRASTR
jgi:riboflavin kinase/FMN adenylyltransferase